jgi:meso-butanediol dehydrogenase / (S,S)-butanediol dehydrogenase / diacetyl reductase
MRLKNKVCLVTGGGSGIGRATCQIFAAEGARLVIADRNRAAAEVTAALCEFSKGAPLVVEADVAKAADSKAMIDAAVERFGRLDVLVNNAGYGIPGTVVETDEDDWNALMAVNVTGVFLACKHAIPIMARQGGGVIVNVASVVASVGITNRAAYCASKGAVAALTRAMAIDHVGEKIRVNAIAPGTIRSPYFDEILAKSPNAAEVLAGLENRQAMKRLGEPAEIASGILYLASDDSSFCTGTILTVDGGMTAY